MEALSWGLTAAAVLLVLYALRVVLQKDNPEHPGQQARLGCGFFFLACTLWSLAAHQWVGGWIPAGRLGLGIFLVTPALGALTRPHGSRLALGVLGLILGIFLAGPVVRELASGWPQGRTTALEDQLHQLRTREGELSGVMDDLEQEQRTLTAALETGGFADFTAVQADPKALAQLERLARVRELLSKGTARLGEVREAISTLEAKLAGSEEAEAGVPHLLGADPLDEQSDLTPVEEYARQKELQALFEELEASPSSSH